MTELEAKTILTELYKNKIEGWKLIEHPVIYKVSIKTMNLAYNKGIEDGKIIEREGTLNYQE